MRIDTTALRTTESGRLGFIANGTRVVLYGRTDNSIVVAIEPLSRARARHVVDHQLTPARADLALSVTDVW